VEPVALTSPKLSFLGQHIGLSFMATKVKIIVKSPNYAEDFCIETLLSNVVLDLKKQIAAEHPKKPEIERQRLIFGGKLLKDEDRLADVLRQYNLSTPPVFHLVMKPNYYSPSGIPQAYNSQIFAWNATNPQYVGNVNNNPPNFPNVPPYNAYPAYMAYHFQQYQYGAFPLPNYNNNNNPNNRGVAVVPGNVAVHQIRININLSLIVKLLILVYVLSQGGSTQRFLLLFLGALLIYLYQTGVLPIFRTFNAPPPQQQNIANNNNNNNNNNIGTGIQPQAFRQRPGLYGEIHGLVVPFFYSLFPTWDPDDIHGVLAQQRQQQQQDDDNPNVPLNR